MALHDRDVEIRRPCPVKLSPDRAQGGARSWYCGHCEKSVHVLSNMTENEARTFLEARAGQDLCVTYAVRRDGSIRFQAEPPPEPAVVPITALTSRRKLAAVGLGMALAACAPHDHPKVESSQIETTERPVTPGGSGPTIPDAPLQPDEVLVDGGIGLVDDPGELVDGEIEPPPMMRGKVEPEPLPIRAGGIGPAPSPPTEASDEPCDPPKADTAPQNVKRGGLRAPRNDE